MHPQLVEADGVGDGGGRGEAGVGDQVQEEEQPEHRGGEDGILPEENIKENKYFFLFNFPKTLKPDLAIC